MTSSSRTSAYFRTDTQKQDAVIRRIEIIGEATAHLSEETRRTIPALPFRKMRGTKFSDRSVKLRCLPLIAQGQGGADDAGEEFS